MAMVPWGMPPREQTYMPHTSSPLNPSSPETSPRRKKRNDQCRTTKHEQSPTQRLMRQKAAVAWRTISSRDTTRTSHAQTTHDNVDEILRKTDDSHPTHTRTKHRLEGVYHDNPLCVRQIDMEKQALADESHRGDWLPETNYPLHSLTTKRLIITTGILCVIGILSALRVIAIGRTQAWRT